jgi:hypothetical protein
VRVFLLGAGASYGHDETLSLAEHPPLMTGLWAAAEERGLLADPNFSDVVAALEVYLSTVQPVSAGPRTLDVEKFLGWLQERFIQLTTTITTDPVRTDRQELRETQCGLSKSYYLVFELFRTYRIPSPESSAYCRLAELAKIRQCALITLNYDCLAEIAFEKTNSPYFYAGLEQPRAPSTPIIKLHGSVNWWNWFGGAIALGGASGFSDIVQSIHSNRAWLKKVKVIPIQQLAETRYDKLVRSPNDYSEPVVIPPLELYKDYMKVNVYGNVWGQACAVLQRCAEVVVIGCSIRPQDDNLCSLLSKALPTGSRIVVVDRDCENVCARLKDVTGLDPMTTFCSFASYVKSLNDRG